MKNYYKHPTSVIDKNVKIGKNTKIWHFCHITSGAQIGENCTIGQNVFISGKAKIGKNVKIQNNVSIFDSVEILSINGDPLGITTSVKKLMLSLADNKSLIELLSGSKNEEKTNK